MDKIVLIDGHSILNRAFYGVPDLTNSEGTHVNAIYGFLNMMFMILEEEKPQYLAVAFDVHKPTFRHEMFSEYKGTRSPMAPELREQVPLIQELLKAMGICVCTLPGYEADDVLGTIAKRSQAEGLEVRLLSGDRDLLQISDSHIQVRIPKTKGGKTTIENYYPDDVVAEYQVTPKVFIDMKALMGDSSDNVHGVTGVGPKSAAKLLVQYGDIDGIYAHIDEMKASAMKENLIRDKEQAYLARQLVTIKIDAPVDFSLESARIGDFFNPESYKYFKRFEFKNYLSRFDSDNSSDFDINDLICVCDDLSVADSFFNELVASANNHSDEEFYISIAAPYDKNTSGDIYVLSIATDSDKVTSIVASGFITGDYIQRRILELAQIPCVHFIVDDAKHFYNICKLDLIEDRCFDVNIAAYLIDPLRSNYDYEYIASAYLNIMVPGKEQVLGKSSIANAFDNDCDSLVKLASLTAYVSIKSLDILKNTLSDLDMLNLFKDIEMPLTRVLSEMEANGIRVDIDTLHDYSVSLGNMLVELEDRIYAAAGEEFNILSPKQLGYILFEKLGLKGGKKTKTGYSTSADVLEKLKDNQIVADILEYRGISKLKSTYADGLLNYISDDNRIRSTFHQTITATGRISSSDPNLQNIPTRTELGRGLRKAFIPADGCIYADADYSQIELRILAHIAGDEQLLEAYKGGADIHAVTAAKVFGVDLEDVTDIQRRNAKAVNFGIVYGISAFGLSEDLGISRKEASDYIEQYFVNFPGIKAYLDGCVDEAKEKGYVTTLYGRRRPIPELNSSNFMQKQFGERIAMNSPIQGTAADIMKIAMIRVFRRMKSENLESKLVLQIHDELLIETYENEKDQVCRLISEEMENAASLNVRLIAEVHTGKDWLEAK